MSLLCVWFLLRPAPCPYKLEDACVVSLTFKRKIILSNLWVWLHKLAFLHTSISFPYSSLHKTKVLLQMSSLTQFGYHTCSKSQGKNQREGSSISAIDPAFLQDDRTSQQGFNSRSASNTQPGHSGSDNGLSSTPHTLSVITNEPYPSPHVEFFSPKHSGCHQPLI